MASMQRRKGPNVLLGIACYVTMLRFNWYRIAFALLIACYMLLLALHHNCVQSSCYAYVLLRLQEATTLLHGVPPQAPDQRYPWSGLPHPKVLQLRPQAHCSAGDARRMMTELRTQNKVLEGELEDANARNGLMDKQLQRVKSYLANTREGAEAAQLRAAAAESKVRWVGGQQL